MRDRAAPSDGLARGQPSQSLPIDRLSIVSRRSSSAGADRHRLISTQAPTEEQKADALKYATETGGFPPLALWSMPQFTPAMVKLFCDKEKLLDSYPMTYITNPEKQIIYTVVSAANNCEMCLSFHAMGSGPAMGGPLSQEDVKLIVDGGLPTQNERARTIAIATKYAICHKGLLLEREASHLESMGVTKEMYGEILHTHVWLVRPL